MKIFKSSHTAFCQLSQHQWHRQPVLRNEIRISQSRDRGVVQKPQQPVHRANAWTEDELRKLAELKKAISEILVTKINKQIRDKLSQQRQGRARELEADLPSPQPTEVDKNAEETSKFATSCRVNSSGGSGSNPRPKRLSIGWAQSMNS